MGEFQIYDCMTRLPIYEGEKVLAIYAKSPKVKEGWAFNPLFGRFEPRPYHCVRFYKGTYDNYGSLKEFDDSTKNKILDDGEVVFMHEDTLEYVQNESKEHPNVMQQYYIEELNEGINEDKLEDHYVFWDELKSDYKKIIKKYGIYAFDWAIGQYASDEADIKDQNMSDNTFMDFFNDFESSIKEGTRKEPINMKIFKQYASEWGDYVYPIMHFCINNHIMLDAVNSFDGHQMKGNYEIDANLRFSEFMLKQAKEIKKRHWNHEE